MKKLALLIALILTATFTIPAQDLGSLDKLTKEDMALLLEDQNYFVLKRLSADPEIRKAYIVSLKQFLAVAGQARKEGFADTPETKSEFVYIARTVLAQAYDKHKNKDKPNMPPFNQITDKEVSEYYLDPKNEAEFQEYVKERIAIARRDGRLAPDREVSKEDIEMIRASYTKIAIYAKEAEGQRAALGPDFWQKVALTTKLQQAQYLAQTYVQKVLNAKLKATDAEIAEYMAAHPELKPAALKTKAEKILRRARAGENFARLARRYSEDPGSKNIGGLYKDVPLGQMVPEFENGALALKPGQVTRVLVESKYGYHILKLERKGKTKNADGKMQETYDVRHILISTMVKDASSPNTPGVALTDHVRNKIEEAKEKKILNEIIANNPVEIAEDFEIKVPPEPPAMPDDPPPALKPTVEVRTATEAKTTPVRKARPKKKRPR